MISIFTFLPLTGCWDRKELNQIGIIMAIGIDKEEIGDKFILTSQIISPSSAKSKEGNNKNPIKMVTTSGNSLFEAVRNNAKNLDRKSFWAHVRVIVISEKVAREGISDVIDFILRISQLRNNSWLIVTKGTEAREVLGVKCGIENIQAIYMEGIIKGKKINSEISAARVIDIIKKIQGEGINPTTGAFKIIMDKSQPMEQNNSTMEKCLNLSDTAIFNKDKLVGYLDNVETRAFNLIMGNVKSTPLSISCDKDESKFTSIEIKKLKSNIIPHIVNGKVSFTINIKVEGNIVEIGDNTDISKLEEFYRINDKFKQAIERDVKKGIVKIQKELKTDVLGFGSALNKKYPKEWKKIKEQWDTNFVSTPYTLNIETNLKRPGLIIKPITKLGG